MPSGHVLVVEDDAITREAIKLFLEFEGYRVDTAANGLEGLELVTAVAPDVVLLDMRMPVLDGWGFAAEIAKRGLALNVVVVSAGSDAGGWAEAIGAQGYLAKPFALDDLLAEVRRFCAPS
jgi:CheY-like chemotaxis protein